MNNVVTTIEQETLATDDCTLSEEMIRTIREAEQEMEANPDKWIDYKDAIRELRAL